MKVPNGDHAEIDIQGKLIGYCLSKRHRTGRHKALVFEQVLGITPSNAQLLADALHEAAELGEARVKDKSADATKYEIEWSVTGPVGTAVVRSGWIIEKGSDVPRLTTCYVRPRPKGASRG